MTELEVVKWIIFGIMGLAVWFLKRTIDHSHDNHIKLESEIQQIKSEYLHKADFREFKTELRGMFEEIRQDLRNMQK